MFTVWPPTPAIIIPPPSDPEMLLEIVHVLSVTVPPKLWRMLIPPPFDPMLAEVWLPVIVLLLIVTLCRSANRLIPPPVAAAAAFNVSLFEIVQPVI